VAQTETRDKPEGDLGLYGECGARVHAQIWSHSQRGPHACGFAGGRRNGANCRPNPPGSNKLCGLVLGRFSTGLPRRFAVDLLKASARILSLPEVRDVACKLIPQLISPSISRRPRTIADLAQAAILQPSTVRACMRRLGESDRAIVRPLDQQQDTWEISHDFLVPLLEVIVARKTSTLWRRFRPWLPWIATTIMESPPVRSHW